MAQNDYPIRRNGYIYSKGTAAGFLRMQRQGIPRPIFSVEDKLRKTLEKAYSAILRGMLSDFRDKAIKAGITEEDMTADAAPGDSASSLEKFLEALKKQEEKARAAIDNLDLKMKAGAVQSELEELWNQPYVEDPYDPSTFTDEIDSALRTCQIDFSKKLQRDQGPLMNNIMHSFSIDKQKIYDRNMEELRRLYLDNSMERIKGEQDLLKKSFLQKLNDYVTGVTDTLDIEEITEELYNRSKHMSQFFARDQLARFNKATTLATFTSAGVTKVKWVTTHDIRVRPSHKALDGQIFDINDLPPEVDDYNCRCGLIPVEYKEEL